MAPRTRAQRTSQKAKQPQSSSIPIAISTSSSSSDGDAHAEAATTVPEIPSFAIGWDYSDRNAQSDPAGPPTIAPQPNVETTHRANSTSSSEESSRAIEQRKRKGKAPIGEPPSQRRRSARTDSSTSSNYEEESEQSDSSTSLVDSAECGSRKTFSRFRVTLDAAVLAQMQIFVDPKLQDKLTQRLNKGKYYSSGQVLHAPSLTKLNALDQFLLFLDNIGFNWLLNIPRVDVPCVLANEFFSSFDFAVTCDLNVPSIKFRLFGVDYNFSLMEWNIRLGIVSSDEASSGEFQNLACGIPGKHFTFDERTAWSSLTHSRAEPFHATHSRAFHFSDPVLRMCQMYVGVNLLGQSTCFSRVSLAELYLVWCMREKVKVNLGFWIAYQLKLISSCTARNLTLCHLLGVLLERNFDIVSAPDLPSLPSCPAPGNFDLAFLRNTGIILTTDGATRFYTPGTSLFSVPAPSVNAGSSSRVTTDDKIAALARDMAEVKSTLEKFKQGLKDFMTEVWELAHLQALRPARHARTDSQSDRPDEHPESGRAESERATSGRATPSRAAADRTAQSLHDSADDILNDPIAPASATELPETSQAVVRHSRRTFTFSLVFFLLFFFVFVFCCVFVRVCFVVHSLP